MTKVEIRGDRKKTQRLGGWLVVWEVYVYKDACEDDGAKECAARFYDAREAIAWAIDRFGVVGNSVEACLIKA